LQHSDQFVEINPGAESYYGGDQSWMNSSSSQYPGSYGYLEMGGCGPVSASNVLAYFEKYRSQINGITGLPNLNNITVNDYNNWMKKVGLNYVKPINFSNIYNPYTLSLAEFYVLRKFPSPIDAPLIIKPYVSFVWIKYDLYNAVESLKDNASLGVLPLDYVKGFNGISNIKTSYYATGIDISALINGLMPSLTMTGKNYANVNQINPLDIIKGELAKDRPVTMLLGLFQYIKYYRDSSPNENYKDAIEAFDTDNAVHYVTITEVIKDSIKGQTFLKVSSWGRVYFIDWNDFINDDFKIGSGIFSYTVPGE
jgi:hypothetical protein